MGVGAGYTIEVRDCKFTSIEKFEPISVDDGLLEIDCIANAIGDIKGDSYYYSSDWVRDVPMVVTNIFLNYGELFDSYKVDPNMITSEAADRILRELQNELDYDADSIQDVYFDEDFTSRLTVNDFNIDEIKRLLLSSYFDFGGSADLGGGWSHSTFTGDFTITCERPFVDESYSIEIPNKYIVEFIDLALTGDNKIYNVVFNGVGEDDSDDVDDAILRLGELIRDEIVQNGIDSVDFAHCYVEELYWTEDVDGNQDFIDPWYDNIVYRADDSDFEDLQDAVGELNEEDDTGVDEGFDI